MNDILVAILTASIGFAGAYWGGIKTLEATKLSIQNEENQNRTVLMAIISHVIILIEHCDDLKSIAFSTELPLCNVFEEFKAYDKIWSFLPKSGLTTNEITLVYLFNMQLEKAYNHYCVVNNTHNGDKLKIEWDLYNTVSSSKNGKILMYFSQDNIANVRRLIKKYFSDVKYYSRTTNN